MGGGFIGGIQNIMRPGAQERSLSGFDMTSRFVQTVIYDVPFFKNTKGLARQLLDGWQVSAITTLQSGFRPRSITTMNTTGGQGFAPRPGRRTGSQSG